jgi:hypothetical protein
MMVAVNNFENQPGGASTAIPGNATAIADFSYYRTKILKAIPEPSQTVLLGISVLAVFIHRRA